MSSHAPVADVSDEEMNTVLGVIDEETGKSVGELAKETGYSQRNVKHILAALMERGKITSTPDWEYRESRRSD